MDENEKKANDLIAQAEKKMKGGFMSNLFGGSGKAEEAISLYERAGNSFKMGKKWQAAGNAFTSASNIALEMKNKHDGANHLCEAANCYKKADPGQAVQSLLRAIEIYTEMGRFTTAAKHHMTIAEMFEAELADVEKATQHYELAADYYKGEESASSANKCLLKVAHLCAQVGQYDKASGIFEQIGKSSMENNLLRYGAKEHFFKATICQMCIDPVNGQKSQQTYEAINPSFADSRECKLIKKLLETIEEQNADAYSEAIREYDSISRLEPWTTTLLLKIKKNFSDETDLC